jgi:flagellar hook assembly protein FlgD
VRAWDVFNNYSESETFFRISGDGSGVVLTDVMNYPNPFTETTRVRFRHNQDVGQPVTLSIFSTEGVRIRTIEMKTDARTMDVAWDGRNDSGTQVAAGMYIVRVQLTGADGSMQAASGQMMRSR